MPQSISIVTIILAGGKGTRLHPLTAHHAKPAVSYGGRYKLIDIPISNAIHSGYRHIFIIAQYLAEELAAHINRTYRFDSFQAGSIEVLTPQENEKREKIFFEGTADAVRKNLSVLLRSEPDYFLILSGDQLYNIDFQKMIDFAQNTKADLTIASLPVHAKEAHRMGLLKIAKEGGAVIDFIEKPQDEKALQPFQIDPHFFAKKGLPSATNPYYLGSMGIYVFKRDSLVSLLQEDPRTDFGYHLIHTAIKTQKVFPFIYHGYWEDIGTIDSYYQANLILTESHRGLDLYNEQKPIYASPLFLPGPKVTSAAITDSLLCEGSVIEAAEITHCVIGLRSHIKKGTILRHTVMMGNPSTEALATQEFAIGENCLIEKAIIEEHVRIGNEVILTNKDNTQHRDVGNGLFIREGIIIVTAGTSIPDRFVL